MSVKKKLTGALAGSMILAAMAPTFAFASIPDDVKGNIERKEDFSADGFDFTYETDEDKGSYISRKWTISDYSGDAADVIIPDVQEGDGNYGDGGKNVHNTASLSEDAFGKNTSVKTVTLPESLRQVSGDAFSGLTELEEFKKADGADHFVINDGVLYLKPSKSSENMYVILPKGKTEDITVSENTVEFMESLPVYKMDIGTLTLPSTLSIDEYKLIGADVDNYAGSAENMITKDGSLFSADGSRLIAYGNDSNADLSSVTEVNPYAFATKELLDKSNLPDKLKQTVPFSFMSGEGEGYTGTRYFSIDGKTAFCYDHGKKNPVKVDSVTEYNDAIDDPKIRTQITRLLCAGAPNDGLGIFEDVFGTGYDENSYGISGDAAKNAVGGLVWELTDSGYTASADDTYGTGTGVFDEDSVEEYIEILREFAQTGKYKGKDYSEDIEKNFKLGFYPAASDEYQGLIVLKESYIPTPEEPEQPEEPEKPEDIASPSTPDKPDPKPEPEEDEPKRHSGGGGGNGGYSGYNKHTPSNDTPVTEIKPEEPVEVINPPVEEIPETPREETAVPKTGDAMALYTILSGLAATTATAVAIKKKNK